MFVFDYRYSFFVLFYCNIQKKTFSQEKKNSKPKEKTIIIHRDCDELHKHRITHSACTKRIEYEKHFSTEKKTRNKNE
jgi:hypothetical protein